MNTKVEITFKSGATVTADVNSLSITHGGSGISSAEWNTPDHAKRRLMHVNLNEVAAIVEVTR